MWEEYVFPYLDQKCQKPTSYHAGNMSTKCSVAMQV